MNNVLAFLGITLLFFMANAVAAGVIFVLGKIILFLFPKAGQIPWFIAGLTGVAAGIGFAIGVVRLISRPPRNLVNDLAPTRQAPTTTVDRTP